MKKKHPNRLEFEGTLAHLDVPSDKPPSGAMGHRVLLTTDAARNALDTLEGMAVDFRTDWANHDFRQKCGVITKAWIEGSDLCIHGHVFARDFPEVAARMMAGNADPDVELGLSYELADALVEDMRAEVFRLTEVTFTGAAILLRKQAAYTTTRIALIAAQAEKFNGRLKFEGTGTLEVKGTK